MYRDGSSVMFPLGSRGVRVLQHQTPWSNDPDGIDLTPTPFPEAKLRIFHTRQIEYFMILYNFLIKKKKQTKVL